MLRSFRIRDSVSLWQTWRRIFALSRLYRGRLYTALALTVISSFISLAVPLGLRYLLDAVFEQSDRALLNRLTVLLFVLFAARAFILFLGRYLMGWVGERVVIDLRLDLYRHMHRLGLHFFTNQRLGEITSRLTNDAFSVRMAATNSLSRLLVASINLAGSVLLMVALNWRLSLLVFLVVPPVALCSRYFGVYVRQLSRNIQKLLAEITAIAEEVLSAIRVVKTLTREAYEVDRYQRGLHTLFDVARRQILVSASYSATTGLLFLIALTAIFWYGGVEVLAGRLTAGVLVAFIFYALNVSRSVSGLSWLYGDLNSAAGASERIFELCDLQPQIQEAPDAVELSRIGGRVVFERVSFGYQPEAPVLHDITFTVEPGTVVALVGISGAGKTTLFNLMARLYDPTEGRILIDGYDIKQVRIQSLRRQIGFVDQDIMLFGISIEDNIRYGRLEATRHEVEAAARAAHAHEFIVELPEGYATLAGERGVKLSTGQRQRITIARTLLSDPRILLLDEATSSIDTLSEVLVQQGLARLMEGRTTFIIAHRLSTVQHADRILVIERGCIVQAGTHARLLRQPGLYRRLCEAGLQESALA